MSAPASKLFGFFNCGACGGEGRIIASKYGGNDPDVWDAGECFECEGSGRQVCEDCENADAARLYIGEDETTMLCEACHRNWMGEE